MRLRAALISTGLLLSACGGYEDASSEAEPDTVEVHANAVLEGVDAMPVADPDANTDIADDTVPADENASSATTTAGAERTPRADTTPAADPPAANDANAADDDGEEPQTE